MTGVHVPACPDLAAHIDAAVRETAGFPQRLDRFADDVQHTWDVERQLADADDLAVIRYWQGVQADFARSFGAPA